ncbi:MAG TPA: PTS glucose transporter subunit IIA [Candidatus Atopostipes pullistercoris]|uniref:PTS glucose transporter subunit IIA n=1 Tax=Candidatus Atopostipes pullistercoris TaxID=2838467 RepID=A0A9D2G2C6_9LACT|nr:PTS glucose transporter subunit IIA [Candidatus Atopostipes pullistercoris]
MGLFDFLKGSKEKDVELYNPVDGEVIPIEDVSDPVFSQKMMGDGYGIEPTNGEIYSPIKGEVVSVFPTKHALGLKTDNGIEVLVHIGIDTVELEGSPFEVFVSEGDKVTKDTLLANVDLEALKELEKSDTVIIVFTNMDDVDDFTIDHNGSQTHGEVIGSVTAK